MKQQSCWESHSFGAAIQWSRELAAQTQGSNAHQMLPSLCSSCVLVQLLLFCFSVSLIWGGSDIMLLLLHIMLNDILILLSRINEDTYSWKMLDANGSMGRNKNLCFCRCRMVRIELFRNPGHLDTSPGTI